MKINRCYGCMEPWSGPGPCPHCGYEPGKQKGSLNYLPEGTVLAGKYVIGRTLGAGGFGITYIAWDMNLDMKLAIKEYYPNNYVSRQAEYSHCVSVFNRSYVSQYNDGLEGFLSEAKTLARFIRQPGIVFVRDYFKENDTAYIVMEFAEGQTLKDLLASLEGERIPADQVFDMMLPVMEALTNVHKAGVIHRDISPDNLMVDEDYHVTLLDFGSARDYTDEKSLSVILKPGYAPEEQYRKRGKQGPWTDVYSICATMYRAITGQVPMEALDRLEQDELKKPSELGIAIRPQQENALMKGLSIRAADRYQSMEELKEALSAIDENASAAGQKTGRKNTSAAGQKAGGKNASAAGRKVGEKNAPAAGQKAEGKTTPLAGQKAEGKTTPLADQKAEGKTTPLAGQKAEGKTTPLAGQKADRKVSDAARKQNHDSGTEEEKKQGISKPMIGAITAAALIVMVGIAALFWIFGSGKKNPTGTETEPETMAETALVEETETASDETAAVSDENSDSAAAIGIELSALSEDEVFADAVTYDGDSQEEFYELLASDEVSAVILDSYLSLTTGTLEVTKPLLLTENSGFDGYVPVVVSGGGYVRIESGGQFNPYEGLLQVTDGGCISVADGGSLACNAFVWLEQEENLLLEEGAELSMNGNSFASLNEALETVPDMLSILDIDEVFADAVHVTTMEEYRTAKDEGVAAIIIDADLTLDEEYNYVDVALMVSEGVTVTGEGETSIEGDNPWTMFLQGGAVLVNYGTITGQLNTDDWDDDDVTDYVTVVNYGTLDYDIVYLQAEGRLLNYGTMRIGLHSIQSTQIYNMGSVSMTGSDAVGEYWIRIRTAFYNYGDLRIESEAPDSGKIEVSLEGTGSCLTNTGTLVLGENSYLYSSTRIHNCGTISLEAENAEFANYGVLYSNESTSVLRAVEGSSWDAYGGAVLYSQDSTVDIPDLNDSDFLCYGFRSTTETVRQVSSENDLNIALVDENCRYILLDDGSTIEVSGDLTLTDKLLVMDGDSTLIIRDGDLTISGENSGLYGRGGTLNLYGGSLILEDGAIALLESSDLLENCVGMTVSENAGFITTSWEAILTGMTIDLSDYAVFNSLYCLELYSCDLTISDGWLYARNTMKLYNSNVQVLSGGYIYIDSPTEDGNMFMDEKSTLTIEEGGYVERGGGQSIIESSIENAGELVIRDYAYAAISGSLVNMDSGCLKFDNEIILTGTLDNQGTIYAVGAVITEQDGGSFTGNEPETIDTW